jgi:hypothetical protein
MEWYPDALIVPFLALGQAIGIRVLEGAQVLPTGGPATWSDFAVHT